MPTDLNSTLYQVAGDVFGPDFTLTEDAAPSYQMKHSVVVQNRRTGLTAVISVSPLHHEVVFPEHGVRTGITHDGYDHEEKQAELYRLCRMVRVYLSGDSSLEYRRRWLRSGTTPIVHVEAEGRHWQLGISSSRVPNR